MTVIDQPSRTRTHRETLEALDELYRDIAGQLPRDKRWADWTDDERQLEQKRIVVDGMKYGLYSLRLSAAAEIFLCSSNLDDLADRIHAGITAREHGAVFAIGWPATFLNEYAREAYATLQAIAAMFGRQLR
jgi:hypothetical protein